MTDLTNPPFTRKPNAPPLYLRDLSPEEMDQWRRMRQWQEDSLKAQELTPPASG
jgi:hypothetical protein